jgi:hypothetical protein
MTAMVCRRYGGPAEFRLERLPAAIRHIETGHARAKIVVSI